MEVLQHYITVKVPALAWLLFSILFTTKFQRPFFCIISSDLSILAMYKNKLLHDLLLKA